VPDTPEALQSHRCIVSNNDTWTFKHPDGTPFNVKVSSYWRTNNANAVQEVCRQGLGIAYLPYSNFQAAFASGELMPVLNTYWGNGSSSWIVYPRHRFLPLKVRTLVEFLLAYFACWPYKPPEN